MAGGDFCGTQKSDFIRCGRESGSFPGNGFHGSEPKYNVSFSRETVEKVESAARELGYQLPGHKNKKENKKEKMIVVFCPTITSPYYLMLLQGIEAVANERGY